MDLGVNGKVFLLAGASKGLGYAIAENLAQAGATLLLGSRDVQRTQASAAQLAERYGTRVVGAGLDMADAESIRAWVARGMEEFGEVNGVLVNAGGPPPGGFDAFTDDDWQSAFNLTPYERGAPSEGNPSSPAQCGRGSNFDADVVVGKRADRFSLVV